MALGLLSTQGQNSVDPPLHLRIHRNDAAWKMDWQGKGKLEWAPSPLGPWESVGNLQPPVSLQPSSPAAFFRLRQTVDDAHHAATWALDLLSPIDEEPKAFDETLLSFLKQTIGFIK